MDKKTTIFAKNFIENFMISYLSKICNGDEHLVKELQMSLLYSEKIVPFNNSKAVLSFLNDLDNVDVETEPYIEKILSRFQNYNATVDFLNKMELDFANRTDWINSLVNHCVERVNDLLAYDSKELAVQAKEFISVGPSFLLCLYISYKYPKYFSTTEIQQLVYGFRDDLKNVDTLYDSRGMESKEYAKLEADTIQYFGQKAGCLLLGSLDEDFFNTMPVIKTILDKYNHTTVRDALNDPDQIVQKLKELGYITYENGQVTIPDILFWYFSAYTSYISNQLLEILDKEESHLRTIDENTTKLIKLEAKVKKLTEENARLTSENDVLNKKLHATESSVNEKIDAVVAEKNILINRLQDTIDKLNLSNIKNISSDTEDDDLINIFPNIKSNEYRKELPDLSGKSVLFVGGRLGREKLEEIFSGSNVYHINADDFALLKNKIDVDDVIFFTDVNSHAMLNLVKSKYTNITYLNNSSTSYLKSLKP
jgi:regulator of replication initiation timing